MFTLEREQFVDTSIDYAWDFLKTPANLNKITPDDLHFTILSSIPEVMFTGLIIEYRIAIPFIGTRKWIAEIKHIREKKSFVDEQRLGPYKFWYHYHELSETDQGIRLTDRVYYEVPYGFVGRILNKLFIKKTLDRIFEYRRTKLEEILSGKF